MAGLKINRTGTKPHIDRGTDGTRAVFKPVSLSSAVALNASARASAEAAEASADLASQISGLDDVEGAVDLYLPSQLAAPGTPIGSALSATTTDIVEDLAPAIADERADVRAGGPEPIYLDSFSQFFPTTGQWVTGQGTTATTTTSSVAAAATVIPVTSGASFPNGTTIILKAGTAQQQIVKVSSGGSTTSLTVTPALTTGLANGETVSPLWQDTQHLKDGQGLKAFAYWVAHSTRPDGTPTFTDPGARPVVIFGNSWTTPAKAADWTAGFATALPTATIVNLGVSGNTSALLLARFDADMAPYANAAYVVINEPGVNDAANVVARSTQLANLEALIAKIRALGATPVITGAVPLQATPDPASRQKVMYDAAASAALAYPALSAVGAYTLLQMRTPAGGMASPSAGQKSTAADLTAFGAPALNSATTGTGLTAFGNFALSTIATGNDATAVGSGALAAATAGDNTAVGAYAGNAITSGTRNVVVGASAARLATTASDFTAVGSRALTALTIGVGLVAVGQRAGQAVTSGNYSVYIGDYAGGEPANGQSTTAQYQTFVGRSSGQATSTQRDNVVALGAAALVDGAGATALGAGAQALHQLSVALGRSTVTDATDQVMMGGRHIALSEVAAPGVAAANGARLFAVDNGSGKTQLAVRFQTGAAIVLATEV
jgi:hypothetical protein